MSDQNTYDDLTIRAGADGGYAVWRLAPEQYLASSFLFGGDLPACLRFIGERITPDKTPSRPSMEEILRQTKMAAA
jgi:hypothetical protein